MNGDSGASTEPVRLLMHVCCGPCAVWPFKALRAENRNIELSAVFYNPNIHPIDEFERRREGVVRLAGHCSVPISVYDDFMQAEWEQFAGGAAATATTAATAAAGYGDKAAGATDAAAAAATDATATDATATNATATDATATDAAAGAGTDHSGCCRMCYDVRLGFAARKAKEEGFDAFSTTLLISPYQNHDLIVEVGEKYQSEYGVRFFYEDFRPAFREGQRMAKDMGIYRQKYCGCIASAFPAFHGKLLRKS